MDIIKTEWKKHHSAGFSYMYIVNREKGVIICRIMAEDNFFEKYISKKIFEITDITNIGFKHIYRKSYYGKAKLHPDDEWDEERGKDIAYRRAFLELTTAREKIVTQLLHNFVKAASYLDLIHRKQIKKTTATLKELDKLVREEKEKR